MSIKESFNRLLAVQPSRSVAWIKSLIDSLGEMLTF